MSNSKTSYEASISRKKKLEKLKKIFEDLLTITPSVFNGDLGYKLRSEHFPSSSSCEGHLLCLFCGRRPPQLDEHHKTTKTCPSKDYSEEQREATRMYARGHYQVLSNGRIELNLVPQPPNNRAFRSCNRIVHQLRNSDYPVFGDIALPPGGQTGSVDGSDSSSSPDDDVDPQSGLIAVRSMSPGAFDSDPNNETFASDNEVENEQAEAEEADGEQSSDDPD